MLSSIQLPWLYPKLRKGCKKKKNPACFQQPLSGETVGNCNYITLHLMTMHDLFNDSNWNYCCNLVQSHDFFVLWYGLAIELPVTSPNYWELPVNANVRRRKMLGSYKLLSVPPLNLPNFWIPWDIFPKEKNFPKNMYCNILKNKQTGILILSMTKGIWKIVLMNYS